MRILFVTLEDVSLHKGSSTHIREKVSAFRRRGHSVVVVGGSRGDPGLEDFRSIGSIRNREGGLSYPALALVFLRLVLQILRSFKHADLIYVREPVAAFATVITKPIHRRNIIFEVNSLDNEEIRMKGNSLSIRIAYRIMSALQRVDARFADGIIVITDRVKEYYESNYKVPPGRIKVQGVTTDLGKFHPMDDAGPLKELRRKLGVPEDAFLVSFIGNLAHWQDFDLLVRSARIVVERNPGICFSITGEGSQREWLGRAVERGRLGDKVRLTGGVPHSEVPLCINACDVCIAVCKELASGYSPMKLFEYFACGKPVVATRVGGYEIVEQVEAGRLIDAGDVEGFASAILTLAEDDALRNRLGENALRFARENFGWDKVIAEIESLMEELLPASAKSHP